MAGILQGVIIFFVLGSEFFVRYRFVWIPGIKSGPVMEAGK
jgi:ABC-type uncharacterized transport system permease subunit